MAVKKKPKTPEICECCDVGEQLGPELSIEADWTFCSVIVPLSGTLVRNGDLCQWGESFDLNAYCPGCGVLYVSFCCDGDDDDDFRLVLFVIGPNGYLAQTLDPVASNCDPCEFKYETKFDPCYLCSACPAMTTCGDVVITVTASRKKKGTTKAPKRDKATKSTAK